MKKTIFNITKMDCPSEEQLIRMRLKDVSDIYELQFDIAGRCLTVYHDNQDTTILQVLEPLNFDSHIISTEVIVDKIVFNKPDEHLEKRLLYQVLMINFVFFIIECSVGIFANSMGLIADSLDMLADSFVYILALSAIGMTMAYKKTCGIFGGDNADNIGVIWGDRSD